MITCQGCKREFHGDRDYKFHLLDCINRALPSHPCPYSEPPPKPEQTTSTEDSVCSEADRIINGERRSDYGPVEESFKSIATMWGVIFKCSVTPSQVALAMACLKICRELNGHKRDSVVDCIGYMALVQRIEESKEEK